MVLTRRRAARRRNKPCLLWLLVGSFDVIPSSFFKHCLKRSAIPLLHARQLGIIDSARVWVVPDPPSPHEAAGSRTGPAWQTDTTPWRPSSRIPPDPGIAPRGVLIVCHHSSLSNCTSQEPNANRDQCGQRSEDWVSQGCGEGWYPHHPPW